MAFIPLAAGLLFLSPWVQATQLSPLARHIPPGKWGLAYQRSGEFKPLFYKHRESGSSSACIQGDPRDYILDWVSGKGCRVDREIELPDRFRLSGECRLKWMPTHAVPVVVDLIFGDEKNFKLDIRSEDDPLVEFREKTQATYLGQCPAP